MEYILSVFLALAVSAHTLLTIDHANFAETFR